MSFSIDQVEEAFHGKHKKVMLVGLAAAAGLGLFVFMKKRHAQNGQAAVTIASYPEAPQTAGGLPQTDSSLQLSQNPSAFQSQLDSIDQKLEGFTTLVTSTQTNFKDLLHAQTDSINQVLGDVGKNVQGVQLQVATGLQKVAEQQQHVTEAITGQHHDVAPQETAAPKYADNQRQYLDNLRSDSHADAGTKAWANQALYLENVIHDGTQGEKAWAQGQLAAVYH